KEEERLIVPIVDFGNDDWRSNRSAPLIAVQIGRLHKVILPLAGYSVATIAIGIKKRSVELIRAALAGHDDGGRPCELSRGTIGLHLHFLNGVEVWCT